jgi:hypothetical protein
MRRFHLIHLLLSSLLVSLFLSCSPVRGYQLKGSKVVTGQDLEPVIPKTQALLYKARIHLYNRRFSGLILLKQLSPDLSHLTFVTEIGMKMFDFEIRNNTLQLVYIFEPLNKPGIIRLLEDDMKLLLLQHILNKEAQVFEKNDKKIFKRKDDLRYYYLLQPDTSAISRILKKGTLFTKVKVNYLYQGDPLSAERIRLRHKGLIRLKIELTKLNRSES